MVRSNMCINAHPAGCAREVRNQIEFAKRAKEKRLINENSYAPKNVLVLGCSTGYGLASRIVAAFEYGAATIGVSFEKEGSEKKFGTPGWYNNLTFDKDAKEANIFSATINADAYADETKARVIELAKQNQMQFDLIVYSLASPVRTDPETKIMYKSVIKPIGKPYSGACIDIMKKELTQSSAEPASEIEIQNTIKVMGGEDWKRWIDFLSDANVLADGCRTIAYSYIGPELSHAIYRDGTIGMAKKHLEKTALELNETLRAKLNGAAFVAINKGLVTRSSAVIPVISLYLSILFKVMKEKGTHEGCIEQMDRLFAERLYTENRKVPTDSEHRIRIDDLELQADVQEQCLYRMQHITSENIDEFCDLDGYKHDFLSANGFDVAGIDYEKEIARFDVID